MTEEEWRKLKVGDTVYSGKLFRKDHGSWTEHSPWYSGNVIAFKIDEIHHGSVKNTAIDMYSLQEFTQMNNKISTEMKLGFHEDWHLSFLLENKIVLPEEKKSRIFNIEV